ncbi:MAG: DegT/DnrJ/EryC1/StrS family aminotransferase [Solirubrobacteraceae bacterium]
MIASTEAPLFDPPVSCSNLVRPDYERFLEHSRTFFDAHRYTNDGPVARELERQLGEFHNTARCVAFSSGFWALVLAIKALALPGREELVIPSLTYRRMADVVGWTGLVPRFCEVDRDTLAISAETAAAVMGPDTALVLAVHPIVNCCEAEALEALALAHDVPLLIDAVESCYETYGGRKVGSFGRAEAFSLHASKLINGFEGGYVTTNDEELANQLLFMRGFGFSGHDNVLYMGVNAKLNEIHAAMALASLDDLEDQVLRNRARYRVYQQQLAGIPGIRLVEFDEGERTSFKNIVVELCDDWPLERDATVAALNGQGILSRAYYSPALHRKSYSYEVRFGDLPVTDYLAARFVLLPCGARVSPDDIMAITSLLRQLAGVNGRADGGNA